MRPGPTFASSEQNMKQSLLWRGLLVWACALAATGCSLLKVSVSSGDPLPDETLRLRTMTRGFYYDLSSGIAAAADSVVAASPRAATQLAAIRWKIRATRAAVEAAMQSDPEVALADTWILCRRMNEAFAQLPSRWLRSGEVSCRAFFLIVLRSWGAVNGFGVCFGKKVRGKGKISAAETRTGRLYAGTMSRRGTTPGPPPVRERRATRPRRRRPAGKTGK